MDRIKPIKRWQIWTAYVKFSGQDDESDGKTRPVLILDSNKVFLLSLGITHVNEPKSYLKKYALKDWKQEGLYQESSVILSNLIELTNADFNMYVGSISDRDKNEILNQLSLLYPDQFTNRRN